MVYCKLLEQSETTFLTTLFLLQCLYILAEIDLCYSWCVADYKRNHHQIKAKNFGCILLFSNIKRKHLGKGSNKKKSREFSLSPISFLFRKMKRKTRSSMKADGGVPAGEGYQKPIPFRIVNQIGQVEIKIEYLYHIPNTQCLQPCT